MQPMILVTGVQSITRDETVQQVHGVSFLGCLILLTCFVVVAIATHCSHQSTSA